MNKVTASSFVHLAKCPCWVSKPWVKSPQAERGTKLDNVVRNLCASDEVSKIILNLNEKDRNACLWAYKRILNIAGGKRNIVSQKKFCKIEFFINSVRFVGELDGDVPSKNTVIELKTGKIRDYEPQVIAYSYGKMLERNLKEYSASILFCDSKLENKYHYTKEAAEAFISEKINSIKDPDKKPSSCESCVFCANLDKYTGRCKYSEKTP